VISPAFADWRYITRKWNNKKRKEKEKKCLCMFSVPKGEREKKWKNCQIHTCGFHCIAKHKEGSLKLCALLVVCSQIWLNLRKAIATFYTSSKFQWMIATLATNRNGPKKKKTLVSTHLWTFVQLTLLQKYMICSCMYRTGSCLPDHQPQARVVLCPILCWLFLPSWCRYVLSSSIQADRHLW